MEDLTLVAPTSSETINNEFLFNARIAQDLAEIKFEKERLQGEIGKYERLLQTLDVLPNELSWKVPHIPLTKHALIPNATLINTNQVTVHIGDNWFTRCSAHHAKSISRRRQQKCRETISALEEREKMLLSWQRATGHKGGIVGGQDNQVEDSNDDPLYGAFAGEDINEFVTEEQYLADKETHRNKVKDHYTKRKEEREKLASEVSDQELWQRLEALEMEEESSGEIRTMLRSERSAAPAREMAPKKKKGGVKFADEEVSEKRSVNFSTQPDESGTIKLGWSWDDGDSSSSDSSNSETQAKTEEKVRSPPRKLSFAQHIETGSDETAVIEFNHTPVESVPSIPKNVQVGELKSPSDIYSNFQEMFSAAAAPRSILKQPKKEVDDAEEWPTISYPFSYIEGDLPSSDSEYENEPAPLVRHEVLLDVVEKTPVLPAVDKVKSEEKVPIVKEEIAEKKEQSPAEEDSVPVRSVKFADPAPEPAKQNQSRGHKKISKFKSSRASSKK